jgi:branched-chain amino acid transport system permease protein
MVSASAEREGSAPVRPALRLPSGRPGRAEALFCALVVSFFFAFPSQLVLGAQILITGLFALSLDLVLGYAGIVSLGHAAFFGIGAYSAGRLAVAGWGEPVSGLLAAALISGLFGLTVSALVVRAQHLGRLMVTLGIGALLHEGANRARSVTGGADGLWGIHLDRLFGIWEFDLTGRTAYAYVASVTMLTVLGLRWLVASPFGLSLRGIREGAARMPAIGSPARQRLVVAFALAAALAGVAGALLAQATAFVSLESLSFERSANVLIVLVLGGVGRLYGGFVGAVVFGVLEEILSTQDPVFWRFWVGCLVVGVALFARQGILGAGHTAWLRWRSRRARVQLQSGSA